MAKKTGPTTEDYIQTAYDLSYLNFSKSFCLAIDIKSLARQTATKMKPLIILLIGIFYCEVALMTVIAEKINLKNLTISSTHIVLVKVIDTSKKEFRILEVLKTTEQELKAGQAILVRPSDEDYREMVEHQQKHNQPVPIPILPSYTGLSEESLKNNQTAILFLDKNSKGLLRHYCKGCIESESQKPQIIKLINQSKTPS